jgi:hypothetical protein
LLDLLRDTFHDVRVNPELMFTHQGFTAEFEKNAMIFGFGRHMIFPVINL